MHGLSTSSRTPLPGHRRGRQQQRRQRRLEGQAAAATVAAATAAAAAAAVAAVAVEPIVLRFGQGVGGCDVTMVSLTGCARKLQARPTVRRHGAADRSVRHDRPLVKSESGP